MPDAGDQPTEIGILEPKPEAESQDVSVAISASTIDQIIATLPKEAIRQDLSSAELAPNRFLAAIVTRVLGATPFNMHLEARRRRAGAQPES